MGEGSGSAEAEEMIRIGSTINQKG